MNKFKREILETGDGSHTLHMPELNEQYHSKHGALNEALHVFIKAGLNHYLKKYTINRPLQILEYGFGTGLNCLLTLQNASNAPIHYTGIEKFPLKEEEITAMDYGNFLEEPELYRFIHQGDWATEVHIINNFTLHKIQTGFEDYVNPQSADLIYFDAFGPRTQPELWTAEIFQNCFNNLSEGGILVTYCAQGQARRNMQAVGFEVERIPGPPGKREMLRASK